MSRIGVIRWLPRPESIVNISTNSSLGGVFSPSGADDWIQADVLVSAVVVITLAVHAHFCRLTKIGMSTLLALVSLLVTLLLAPLVGSVLFICACYRHMASACLRAQHPHRFSGLLDGSDVFWALEEDTSLSVINVLALADFSFIVSASTQEDEPLQTISELIQDRLLSTDSPSPKLLCHRHHSWLGYLYWVKRECINISEHIRWMEIENEEDQITESTLKNFVSLIANTPLPSNHKAGWEILVGRYPIKPSSDLFDAMENGGWTTKSCAGVRYPVLFRVHHSIGDGVALVNLLLESLGDPSTRCNTPVTKLRSPSPGFEKNFVINHAPSIPEESGQPIVVSSWQESDKPKFTTSSSCDFKSIFVDIPLESNSYLRKSNSFCFNDSKLYSSFPNKSLNDLKQSVKKVCHKVLNFINETKDFKYKLNQKEIDNFDIVVNDRPSAEFVNMMKKATTLESNYVVLQNSHVRNKYFRFLIKRSTNGLRFLIKLVAKLAESLKCMFRQWSVLLFAPATIFNQTIAQIQDENLLHGPQLSGHKVVAWYLEQQDNPDQLLMTMIKRIRSKTGVRFSDVLLTALSASLESFYAQSNEIPQCISVVIPARVGPSVEAQSSTKVIKAKNFSTKVTKIIDTVDNTLENKFSVAIMSLPIANDDSMTKLRLFYKLRQVRKHCDVLRNSPDYLINYWLLRVVATLIPTWFLRPLLKSTHSTLVLSNLPGPARLTKLAGHTLHDLVFWVPNRTTTGVGVTVLSYAGRLQLGLIADRALIACQQDGQLILDGIAAAIEQMDQISSPN